MQVKKSELRDTILETAKLEFLRKGYTNSSMRTIARKANTTIGNIYHYFPNKEAILDELLVPLEIKLQRLLEEHIAMNIRISGMDEINYYLDQVDMDAPEMQILVSDEIAIFIKTDVEKHKIIREMFLAEFRKHIAWHMNVAEDNHYIPLVMDMILECVVHLNKCVSCAHDRKSDIIQVFRMLCSGIMEKNKRL